MSKRPLCAVVLAAGQGTRMHSTRPKPLHRLCGRPMILHVLDALGELPVVQVVAVVGHRGEWVTKTLVDRAPSHLVIDLVEQREARGTGDALAIALTALPASMADEDGDVVVVPGDAPLVRGQTLAALVKRHQAAEAAATLLTAQVDDPTGYDRVVRGKDHRIERVVYDADADEGFEVAMAIHCFRLSVLAPALRRLHPVGPRREYSLTGLYAVLRDAGYRLESLTLADPAEAIGVNDRAQLALAEAELRLRINDRWLRKGVTMWDPDRTYVDATVHLDPDVVLLPGVILQGDCRVAAGAEIGPESHLLDTAVGAGARVLHSSVTKAVIGAGSRVGPLAVVEPGAVVEAGAVVAPFTVVPGSSVD